MAVNAEKMIFEKEAGGFKLRITSLFPSGIHSENAES